MYEHSEYDKPKVFSKRWGFFDYGYNCKMRFRANKRLNGKLRVEVESINDARAFVYLMPNEFNESYEMHGIFENDKMESSIVAG